MADPAARRFSQPSNNPRNGVAQVAAISFPTAQKPKLLDQVRQAIRTRHYSPITEETYVHWIKRFIFFRNKRHPAEMGEKEIAQFLSSLASEQHVSASTQNQASNAILFFYRHVLRKDIGYVDGVVRANRPKACRVLQLMTLAKRTLRVGNGKYCGSLRTRFKSAGQLFLRECEAHFPRAHLHIVVVELDHERFSFGAVTSRRDPCSNNTWRTASMIS